MKKYKKYKKRTKETFSLNLVLNEANIAYLELTGIEALPTSCHNLQTSVTLYQTSSSLGGSEENVDSNHRFPKFPTSFRIPSQQFLCHQAKVFSSSTIYSC